MPSLIQYFKLLLFLFTYIDLQLKFHANWITNKGFNFVNQRNGSNPRPFKNETKKLRD